MAEPSPLPIACTLTPAALAGRVQWLRGLGARSLVRGRRAGGTLDLTFAAAAGQEVRAWAAAEQECCAFLSFDLRPAGEELEVRVTGPAGAEPVLDGLLAALRSGGA